MSHSINLGTIDLSKGSPFYAVYEDQKTLPRNLSMKQVNAILADSGHSLVNVQVADAEKRKIEIAHFAMDKQQYRAAIRTGAVAGATIGASVGAVVGAVLGFGVGAAIGAAVGLVAGAAIGALIEAVRNRPANGYAKLDYTITLSQTPLKKEPADAVNNFLRTIPYEEGAVWRIKANDKQEGILELDDPKLEARLKRREKISKDKKIYGLSGRADVLRSQGHHDKAAVLMDSYQAV